MKKTIITISCAVALFIVGNRAIAQQQVQFTQYMFNQTVLNPAYAGIHDGLSASMLWREQWIGFEGAPSTQTFSLHSPLMFRSISLGGVIMRDKIGLTSQISTQLQYAYRIRFGQTKLSFGLQASFSNYRTDFNIDGLIDPTLLNADLNITKPNFGSGLLWHGEHFYVGFSVPNIMNQLFDPNNVASQSRLIRHYFFTAGYVFPIAENIMLKPNFLLKAVQGAPVQADINMNVLLQNIIWVGVSYRSLDSFDALVQFQATKALQIGYAFDFATTTDLGHVSSGSHEIMINYFFQMPHTRVLTPRYF
jgi:type IX secretion system PorP/SprF family membrane protein